MSSRSYKREYVVEYNSDDSGVWNECARYVNVEAATRYVNASPHALHKYRIVTVDTFHEVTRGAVVTFEHDPSQDNAIEYLESCGRTDVLTIAEAIELLKLHVGEK